MSDRLASIEERIVNCRRCPRLVEWRERVAREKRASFASEEYWGRPIPGFGDPSARVYVLGLAPAAHGGNRTGRVFTGDRSGDWLFASMYRTGFANQALSVSLGDGLTLHDAWVAAAVRCAPPANKPLPVERDTCLPYAREELDLMPSVRVIVCLGAFAWDAACRLYGVRPRPRFGHGAEHALGDGRPVMLGCFHPSQQNTFTGKLTEPMMDAVFERAAELAAQPARSQGGRPQEWERRSGKLAGGHRGGAGTGRTAATASEAARGSPARPTGPPHGLGQASSGTQAVTGPVAPADYSGVQPITSLRQPAAPLRPAPDVLVARQPVYDPSLKVVAYELLVQRRDGSSAADEAEATSTISEIGLNLVAGQPAYIPVSRAFLLEGFANALPAERVTLAIGPDLQLDRPARDALESLFATGYRLALIDYEPDGPLEPLLSIASVVGINVAGLDRAVLRDRLARLARRGVQTLARNVEQHDELEMCISLGFDLLQGYFICRPRVVSEQGLKVTAINRVRLIQGLRDEHMDFDDLHEIIVRDVALSYNLLRFINSAFFALPRRVESIRDALVLLGSINVRKWATLMALADSQDKPRELVVTGLVRARMCELLAAAHGKRDLEGAFTTGLFSVVDALTDRSMVELLQSLPLSSEIIQALLNHEGSKGRILRAAIAYERGDFGELGNLPPTRTPLSDLYAEAVAWATEASGGLPDVTAAPPG